MASSASHPAFLIPAAFQRNPEISGRAFLNFEDFRRHGASKSSKRIRTFMSSQKEYSFRHQDQISHSRSISRSPVPLSVNFQASSTPLQPSSPSPSSPPLAALIFDCDGVILESEDLHRRAYNETFAHFKIKCPHEYQMKETSGSDWEFEVLKNDFDAVANWSVEFYDGLQNRIGGGKPKMRWYFDEFGWPSSSLFLDPPISKERKAALIDKLQDWKTLKYQQIIGSGGVQARPGVLRLMDEAKARGVPVAVCSAATKSSVVFCLNSLLGKDRFESLDCFMAGDDVDKKKPDPTIYRAAAERLNVDPSLCVVIEDSLIGLLAAKGAGMKCVVTHTPSTRSQSFSGALAVFEDLGSVDFNELQRIL